ncbi:hypothetical protein [Dongia sp.]|uniref:hypothetical protein n=1 Tax=Dongia sp. TaxID=1977262 RepID=UPI0035ADD477
MLTDKEIETCRALALDNAGETTEALMLGLLTLIGLLRQKEVLGQPEIDAAYRSTMNSYMATRQPNHALFALVDLAGRS